MKQRIPRRLERADHRSDVATLDQSATRARLPDAAGTLHDVSELLRAAHRHHATKLPDRFERAGGLASTVIAVYQALVGSTAITQVGGTASPRASPPHRARRHGQRLPAGNGPSTGASLRGVGHAREQPAQLDCGRQLAALLESGTDRGGLCLGDDEHAGRMGVRIEGGKRPCRAIRSRWCRPRGDGSPNIRGVAVTTDIPVQSGSSLIRLNVLSADGHRHPPW